MEMGLKQTPQLLLCDEMGTLNAQNEDFFVDQLFDFSNEVGFVDEKYQEEEKGSGAFASASQEPNNSLINRGNSNQSSSFRTIDDFGFVPTSEISVPADDLEDLEWLSHLVEDSFSEYSTPFPAGTGIPTVKPANQLKNPPVREENDMSAQLFFKTPVPAKARSKRTRTGGRLWSLGSPCLTESSSSSTASSSSSSEPFFSLAEKFSAKKPKRKVGSDGGGAQAPRRCSHCGVQKTPQWRSGPLGTKTLCNACGVRYKSGRLFPEYRPACSPTFSSLLHSNHHRKVLEMRQKKETVGEPDSELGEPVVGGF